MTRKASKQTVTWRILRGEDVHHGDDMDAASEVSIGVEAVYTGYSSGRTSVRFMVR